MSKRRKFAESFRKRWNDSSPVPQKRREVCDRQLRYPLTYFFLLGAHPLVFGGAQGTVHRLLRDPGDVVSVNDDVSREGTDDNGCPTVMQGLRENSSKSGEEVERRMEGLERTVQVRCLLLGGVASTRNTSRWLFCGVFFQECAANPSQEYKRKYRDLEREHQDLASTVPRATQPLMEQINDLQQALLSEQQEAQRQLTEFRP